jgi:hypothetical protein
MGRRTSLPLLLTLLLVASADAQTFTKRPATDVPALEKELESQAAKLKSADPKDKPPLAESHVRAHLRLATALADDKRYALAVTTLRRAKAAANQHMIFKRAREVVGALDDQIAFVEWREKSDGRGLRCELFEESDFTSLKKTRIDHSLDFAWSSASPDIDVPGDSFSARWTGALRAPVAGRYKFVVHHDDDVRMWIDERLVIERGDVGRAEAFIELTGKPQSLRVELQDLHGGAGLSVAWVVPGAEGESLIPPDCLFADKESADRLAGKPWTLPKGRGLRAEIFAGRDFQKPFLARTEPDIDHNFQNATPDPRLPTAFSIRFSGYLKAPKPGRYKLTACVDDGIRLWLDNQLLLERWPSHVADHDITVDLTGKPHALVLEYHQIANRAWVSLHWQNLDAPDSPRVPIPPEAFFTDRAVAERAGILDEVRAP